ncbi:MAG: hypothetical protein PWR13_1395, partial [Archaeoglobi archaeon]|nr:hypothetical protein [Archaeoglobi archaeon]
MKRILFLFFALLLSGCLQPVEESFTHEVEYEVSISFREISEIEQTNVTLKTWEMKPIPVGIEEGNNTPKQTPQLVKRPASYEFKL